MAEAIGVASSVAQLVTVAAQIAKLAYGYIVEVRNASRAQKAYLQEVSAFVDVLLQLEVALQDSEEFSVVVERPRSISSAALEECRQNLAHQHAKLEKHIHKLLWPFHDRDLRKAIDDLHRFRGIFSDFAIANASLVSSATLRNVDALRENQEQARIFDWLNPGEGASKIQPDAIPGTGSWFLTEPKFREWCEGDPSTLWCHGAPRRQQNDLTILQSILRQVVKFDSEEVIPILSKCRREASSSPKADELFNALKEICTRHKVYLIIDALDELNAPKTIVSRFLSLVDVGGSVLVTSRDHPDLRAAFSPGSQFEVYSHPEDMDLYILHRFQESDFNGIIGKTHAIVEQVTLKASSLFLLVRLIMDQLLQLPTIKHMRKALATLPTDLDIAYESSLKRIDAQPQAMCDMAHRLIRWIIYAERPLQSEEIVHAFAIEPGDDEIDDEGLVMIQTLLRTCVGLVVIDHQRMTLGLVHATAYQFFHSKSDANLTQVDIARTALAYLCLSRLKEGACDTIEKMTKRSKELPFLDYAARHWGRHTSNLDFEQKISDSISTLLEDNALRSSAFQALQYRPSIKNRDIAEAAFASLPRKQNALHVAAYWGLQLQARAFIAAGTDINASDSQQWTPLHWATSCGHVTMMNLLLGEGANVDARDSQQWTPLFWASFRGSCSALQLLLKSGANHLSKDVHGWTALHWAVSRGENPIVTILLKHHAAYIVKDRALTLRSRKPNCSNETTKANEVSPLEVAADTQNANLFDELLKQQHETSDKVLNTLWASGHFDPPTSNMWRVYNKAESMYGIGHFMSPGEWLTQRSNDREWKARLLHTTIKDNKLSVMQLLIEIGADVNFCKARAALHVAAFRKDARFAQILIENGASVSTRDFQGQTALHQAVLNGFEDTILVLLQSGSDVNARREGTRYDHPNYFDRHRCHLSITNTWAKDLTPLMLACGYNSTSDHHQDAQARIIALLLSHGGDPALQDEKGRNSLHYAASTGSIGVMHALIATGVDVNIRDQRGMTALHHAAEFGDLEVLQSLCQANAIVDVADARGATPLHFAAQSGNTNTFKELLGTTQDVDQQDLEGVAVLHYLARSCNLEMIKLLIGHHGADTEVTDKHGRSTIHYLAACKEADARKEDLERVFKLLYKSANPAALNYEYDTIAAEGSLPSYSQLPRHTALSKAIQESNWKLFRILRDAGGTLPTEISGLLGRAIEAVQPTVVRYLIENGATLQRQQSSDGRLSNEVLRLHSDVDAEDLDLLLQDFNALNVDINEHSFSDQTLLSTSACNVRSEIVAQVLVKHGSNPYELCRGFDSIVLAAIHHNPCFLRGLLANLPKPYPKGHWANHLILQVGQDGAEDLKLISRALRAAEEAAQLDQRVLIAAVKKKHVEFVESLLRSGMNPCVEDQCGWTPLHHAVLRGLLPVVKLLLEAGADVNAAAKEFAHDHIKPSGLYRGNAWTGRPVHVAALLGDEKIMSILLAYGADVNTSTGLHSIRWPLHGPTPLHVALGTGDSYCIAPNLGESRLRIAKMLIDKGANLDGVGDHLTQTDVNYFENHEDVWRNIQKGLSDEDALSKG
ncbi:MAG: hypothetical protein Q9227_005952 [Pyrenula ochraceoflavens]